MSTDRSPAPSPPLVAVIAWLVPGAGYLLLGQRARALTVGITIILLFILGLLIGGVRVLEVPGYDDSGRPIEFIIRNSEDRAIGSAWVMWASPLSEIRNKPWSVPQALTGPLAIAGGAWSIHAATTDPQNPSHSRGEQSHSRINEIGSLYLSVAGLLNLLAIIDSAYRASQRTAS